MTRHAAENPERSTLLSREFDEELLSHPLLCGYWPSERRAILLHRMWLCEREDREVGLEETISSWERGASREWRREKMRIDGQRQLLEIERHKYVLSERLGYDVGWEAAARDWIEHYAAAWRAWWEEQPESEP